MDSERRTVKGQCLTCSVAYWSALIQATHSGRMCSAAAAAAAAAGRWEVKRAQAQPTDNTHSWARAQARRCREPHVASRCLWRCMRRVHVRRHAVRSIACMRLWTSALLCIKWLRCGVRNGAPHIILKVK